MRRSLLHTFSGGWNPRWLGSGLKVWFDPEYGITKDGVTNRVSAWADRLGALTVSQGVGANQFLWVAAASEMNGRASLLGDASRLMSASGIAAGLRVTQQAHTYIAITRASGDVLGTGSTTGGHVLLMRFNSKVRSHVWATGALSTRDGATTISPTTRGLVGQVATGAPGSGELYPILNGAFDNTSVSITGTPATPSDSLIIGCRGTGVGADTLNGYLGDVLVMDRAITAAELVNLNRWAKQRWNY